MTHERVPIQQLEEKSQEYCEDLARYRFAAQYVSGSRVLDVACGTGYGSNLLVTQGGARYVVGADLDSHSSVVRDFRIRNRVEFLSADCCRLPLRAGSVDIVVSMETIEHVNDPKAYLAEVARVLRPGGTAIISTPVNNSPQRFKPENPYHVREYSCEEFQALLEGVFRSTTFWSQVTTYRDDTPQWVQAPSASGIKKLAKLVLPVQVRKAVRTMMGSKGLQSEASRIVSGRDAQACVQIGVCV